MIVLPVYTTTIQICPNGSVSRYAHVPLHTHASTPSSVHATCLAPIAIEHAPLYLIGHRGIPENFAVLIHADKLDPHRRANRQPVASVALNHR